MNTPDANTLQRASNNSAYYGNCKKHAAGVYVAKAKMDRSQLTGIELYGKTLGVVGLGRIGAEVAKRMASFGMKIIGYDPFVTKEKAESMGIEVMELAELFKQADIITIHVPKTKDTKDLICKAQIDTMKKNVILINCARGGIINEQALYEALKSGRVQKAALDVFDKEPPFDSPLLELDNIVLTPHLGASTVEAQEKVGTGIIEQVVEALKGGMVRNGKYSRN